MKQIPCPNIGLCPAQEFFFGGEVREMPDPAICSDAEWADYVFNRAGEPGIRKEWWYHIPSGTWFIAERDNQKDVFIRTYLMSDHLTPKTGAPSAYSLPQGQGKSVLTPNT